MFYLIREWRTKTVIGIMSEFEVLEPRDRLDIANELARGGSKLTIDNLVARKLIDIVNWNMDNIKPGLAAEWIYEMWNWEPISQAEYETYRDLHEFVVFTRMNEIPKYFLTCPSGTKR